MKIRYSRHARNQMRLWKISRVEIMEVLDKAGAQPDHRSRGGFFATLLLADRMIKIAFVKEGDGVFIKTVFPLRNP